MSNKLTNSDKPSSNQVTSFSFPPEDVSCVWRKIIKLKGGIYQGWISKKITEIKKFNKVDVDVSQN